MMKNLQKLGKALMLPVAALPICGILMGLGYAFAPAAMGAAGATEGFAYVLGVFLIKAGAALIDNMAILFAIGVGVGLANDNDGTADQHLRPGLGNIDWDDFSNALEEIGFEGCMSLETSVPRDIPVGDERDQLERDLAMTALKIAKRI